MLTKHLLKLSLLLPLVAISTTAHAGSTIPQNVPSYAFASTVMTPRFQAGPMSDEGRSVRRYHGGPKGQ
jgi:hypothetical protein